MKVNRRSVCIGVAALAATLQVAISMAGEPDFDSELLAIAQAWDHANFEIPDATDKRDAFEVLSMRAAAFAQRHPGRAEPLVWEGIVLSSYAGAKGGLGALSLAKGAREHLLAALKISPEALGGSAYTSLGVLYYKVPGFPLGFGNHGKAREYLSKALALNPNGMDPNFFYGELLFEEGDYQQSLQYLQKAQAAAPRSQRQVADDGRRKEIAALMARVRAKLS
jgi:tetratricopeptide (TPR) repeat protein